MKKLIPILALVANSACAQTKGPIDVKEVTRIETALSSDEMRGRRAGTPDIDRAANFIADEFRKAGLQPWSGNSFLQSFVMIRPKMTLLKAEMDEKEVDTKGIIVITTQADFKVNEKSGYAVEFIRKGDNLGEKAMDFAQLKRNAIVFVDTAFSKNFPRLTGFKRSLFKSDYSTVFILGTEQPKTFTIKAEHSFEETKFANVAGMLPGRSKKDEYVVFSGHYDHLGIGKPVNGDSLYNGANDDAAGTTAVMALASYFKKANNNERSIIFVAFTAEEVGGFGSQYFSRNIDPARVMAMFNIEMIGTESKWGKNSAYITGFEKSNMGEILQRNLKGSDFAFYPDPYPAENLFYRSDNARLAMLGVPAHTISTSKMDSEPNYHKPSDEVGTLDLENMARIIEAIARSSMSIVSGKETPSRVKPL